MDERRHIAVAVKRRETVRRRGTVTAHFQQPAHATRALHRARQVAAPNAGANARIVWPGFGKSLKACIILGLATL